MRFIMKKILSLLLSAVIIFSGFCFAFADDPEDSSSGSSAEVFSFSDSELEFISQASDEDDRHLRQASVIMAATSTYDIDDIYSILSSVRTIENSRYVWATFDESLWSEVHNVYNKLITNSYNNTYYSISELVAQLLIQFNSFSSFFYSPISGSASLWQLTDDIKTFVGLGLFDSNANSYLSLIDTKIGTLTSSMTSGFNAVLSSVNSTINAVNNTTNAVNNTTNSVNNVKSSVDLLSSVSWHTYSNNFLGIKTSLSGEYISTGTFYSSIVYAYFVGAYQSVPDFSYTNVYRFDVPVRQNSTYQRLNPTDIKLYYFNGDELDYRDCYFIESPHLSSVSFYFNDLVLPRTGTIILSFHNSNTNNLRFDSSASSGIFYISDSDIDFYYVHNYVFESSLYQIVDTFKDLYASDDIIAAKQGQQSYEDQVISDFTGSGSASAKLSDAASAKDISSSVSSGLVSGASVNNSLSVFGTNSGFWGWFSQENSDLINTLSSQSQLRSSGSGSDWVLDDPYQRNADELQSILGGNR